MTFAVHLFCYSALKTGREGRGEGGVVHPGFCGLAGGEKHEEKSNFEKEKQSEQPSLPPLFYCSTLFLVYPLSPHSFGESPGFELFLNVIYK